MKGKESLSLVYAVPDHPWLKASDKAAVRIAMTVSEKGLRQGVMAEVLSETGLNTDTPLVELKSQLGEIDSNLSVGAKLTSVNELKSNQFIAFQGFKPYGAGFIITAAQADAMIKRSATLSEYIRPYLNGRDVAQHSRNVFAVDFHGLSLDAVRTRYPEVYQHMLQSVKPERDHVKMEYRRKNWWLFGQPSTETRNAIQQISSFLITPETAKHRYFLKLKKGTLPDQKLRLVAIDSYNTLSILSSRLHVRYAESQGNWQGIGNDPVYTHNSCFNTFSFPVISENHALQDCLRELGERLDSFRKERLATHGFLTMTGLYNALERLREIENGCAVEPLSAAERDVHEAGLISVLKEIHDDIDRAVLSAYGWNDLAPALVGKPGGTVPSEHKSEPQLEAEEELLRRLVALNHERVEEEKQGMVRWLRPDYQIPKLGAKAPKSKTEELDLEVVESVAKPKWPGDGLAQIRLVRDMLARSASPTDALAISSAFDGRNSAARKDRVAKVLETMVATGAARAVEDGTRYFVPR